MTVNNSFAEAFHKECEKRGINPRNVHIINGQPMVTNDRGVIQCTNGMVVPKKKR